MKFNVHKRFASWRDFSFHKSKKLGAVTLPNELLFISPILNQDQEDCTAYAAVATRYNETGDVNFDPAVFWQEELSFAGLSSNANGFDISVPAAVGVECGFPTDKASAYIWVTAGGGNDLFANVRMAIFTEQRPVIVGLVWDNSWTAAPDGIISSTGTSPLGGHCMKVAGFTTINDTEYLVLQQSWGDAYGVNGLYYMTRDVANQAIAPFGCFYWSDSQNFQVKTLGLISALYTNIITLLSST